MLLVHTWTLVHLLSLYIHCTHTTDISFPCTSYLLVSLPITLYAHSYILILYYTIPYTHHYSPLLTPSYMCTHPYTLTSPWRRCWVTGARPSSSRSDRGALRRWRPIRHIGNLTHSHSPLLSPTSHYYYLTNLNRLIVTRIAPTPYCTPDA